VKSELTFHRLRLLVDVVQHARLVWRLFWDRRVPLAAKLVVPAAVAALVSPIDLIPDVLVGILGLGVVDDLALLLIAARLVVALAPPEVVAEHLARLRGVVIRPSVDATFRPVADPSYRVQ
jgi:uncharacterized membrane protein YkvA (DUF1232 family)